MIGLFVTGVSLFFLHRGFSGNFFFHLFGNNFFFYFWGKFWFLFYDRYLYLCWDFYLLFQILIVLEFLDNFMDIELIFKNWKYNIYPLVMSIILFKRRKEHKPQQTYGHQKNIFVGKELLREPPLVSSSQYIL